MCRRYHLAVRTTRSFTADQRLDEALNREVLRRRKDEPNVTRSTVIAQVLAAAFGIRDGADGLNPYEGLAHQLVPPAPSPELTIVAGDLQEKPVGVAAEGPRS